MKTNVKRTAAALLAILFLAAAPLSAFAATDYKPAYAAVLERLASSNPSFGSVGGEWLVIAVVRGGKRPPSSDWCKRYFDSIESMVRANGSGVINPNRSTDNSRLVLALTAIGRNARSVAGYDLVQPLCDISYTKRQGVTGAAFALLALGCNSAYGESAAKNELVDFLLAREKEGGGWSLSAQPDVDATAMVMTALAPYSKASAAVKRGINWLSQAQKADGSFATLGSVTCESSAQVVTALSAVGINADTDSRFIKNGVSALAALVGFYSDGGFAHTPGGAVNGMATEQAAYSLCAYDRYRKGANSLFDMNDVSLGGTGTPKPTNTPKPTSTPKPTNTPKPTAEPRPTNTPKPTVTPTQGSTDAPSAAPSEAPAQTPKVAPSGGQTAEAQTPAPTEVSFTGPVQTETAPTGPVQTETASTGPVQSETAPTGPVQSETAPTGPAHTEKPDGPDANAQTGAAKKALPYAGGAAALALAAVLAVVLIKRKKRDEN